MTSGAERGEASGMWSDARPAVVLLDFGGTLDASGLAWRERLFRLYQTEGVVGSPDDFDTRFYAVDDALAGGVPSTLSFGETVVRLVEGLSNALGSRDGRQVDRIATRFLTDALGTLRGRMPLLERLAGKYRLGMVSNFYGNLATVCRDAGIGHYFSVIVDSTRVGWTKPDPRIFRHALAALDVDPLDAVFVGDSLRRDMVGARSVGMRHVWLVPPGIASTSPCCANDPVIHALDELEWLLP